MRPAKYERRGKVAVITMDDGKRNAISPNMISALSAAMKRAAADDLVPVLTGREGTYSAGFDLKVMKRGGLPALKMLRDGMKLAARILRHPRPVVVACTGDAYAMGLFLVLVGDDRLGATGGYTMIANEVAVAFTLPRAAIALCRAKISPPHLQRTTLLSHPYSPQDALAAGLLDELHPPENLLSAAVAKAEALHALDWRAHSRSKARVQAHTARAMRLGLVADTMDWAWAGVKQVVEAKLSRKP